MKTTTLTALGASLIGPMETFAEENQAHDLNNDFSPRLTAIADDFDIHFLAIGDWGRNGEYDQNRLGKQMGLWAKNNPTEFVISAGDNFYPKGVISEFDPLWHYSFEDIYTAHSLHCDWYPVLGNHDYESPDPESQLRYSKISRRWNMPAFYYSKEMTLKDNSKVLFVFMDTDPFLFESKKDYCATQLKWLENTFKNASPGVKWKIVIGHHPYYTVGPRITHFDTLTMRAVLPKIFEENKVDIYLSGHDHSLQHLKPQGFTHQFISGAGSELTAISEGIPYTRFAASENGFMYFRIKSDKINVKAVNVEGNVLYEGEVAR